MPKYQPIGIGMTPSKTKLGKFLRACRIKLGLRQARVAELLGMLQGKYSTLEIGKRRYLAPKEVEDLSRVLQCEKLQLEALAPKMRKVEPKTEFGKFVRSRREQLGLTWDELSKRLQMSRAQVCGLEVGRQQGVRYRTLKLLAKALDLEISALSKFISAREKVTNSILGQLVRSRRKELKLSQKELANNLRVTPQFVSQIESGQVPLSLGSVNGDSTLERLAKTLKLDIAKLQAVRPRRRLKQKKAAPTTLGGFLTARRLELGITQGEVAKRAETSPSEICGVEVGRIRPNAKLLDGFAKALECEIPARFLPEGRR